MEMYRDQKEYLKALATHSQLPKGFLCSTTALQFYAQEKPATQPFGMRLSLIFLEEATSLFEAVFTRNSFPGVPVLIGRERVNRPGARLRGILINNKISNVCTLHGRERAELLLNRLSELTDSPALDFVPCSTGIIGWELPAQEIADALPALVKGLKEENATSALQLAQAIMTTDAFPKMRTASFKGGRIVGVAKGAGMIEPNLATMLVYLMTDFDLTRAELKETLRDCVDQSFNTISIDSDQSTSDTVFLISSGKGPRIGLEEFKQELRGVCQALATDIVRNGEGTAHVMQVHLKGTKDRELARQAAKAIVNSPLVKTAMNGNDPNVGRLLAALGDFFGSHSLVIDPAQVTISLGGEVIFSRNSFQLDSAKEKRLSDYLADRQLPLPCPGYPAHARNVEIEIIVGQGEGEVTVFGSDLSSEYVTINADYRT
jgi:glutamate N-acetyltransferase/amino-acid N-acetyltransferase